MNRTPLNFMILLLIPSLLFGIDKTITLTTNKESRVVFKTIHVKEKTEIGLNVRVSKNVRFFNLLADCWIMDAASREVIWQVPILKLKPIEGTRNSYEYQTRIDIDTGYYYCIFVRNHSFSDIVSSIDEFRILINEFVVKIIQGDGGTKAEKDSWWAEITFDSDKVSETSDPDIFRHSPWKVSLNQLKDDEYRKSSFTINKPGEKGVVIQIYAQGEGNRAERMMYDYGWLSNSRGEKVWDFSTETVRHAGGAKKNICYKGQLFLPNDNYTLVWITDDSHSFDNWNESPPLDALFWGVAIRPRTDADTAYWKSMDPPSEDMSILIEMTKVGSDQLLSRDFILDKPALIRIVALGEYSFASREMVDYGWIIQKKTHSKIWQMDYDNTVFAGGSRKNRGFDDAIRLDAGEYTLYYVTDDSHAWNNWNDQKPKNSERYGITLYRMNLEMPPSQPEKPQTPLVPLPPEKKISEPEGPADKSDVPLIAIQKVGSDQLIQKEFTLNRPSKLEIYCLGEGKYGMMYDYGWIVDNTTGKVIWKMLYENSAPAGGSQKNRRCTDTIILEKGRYRVYYITDDSHAYHDWNEKPPNDPFNWGIQIKLLETY